MSGMMRSPDINAEGVAGALQLVGDALRLSTATPDQLEAAAAFLARARARFPDSVPRDARKLDAGPRLDAAGQAIGAEMRRRAFDHSGTDAGFPTQSGRARLRRRG
jgi:hypothetical protein